MPATCKDIDALIADLARAQLRADAFNQYGPHESDDASKAIRRANLRLYCRAMARRQPRSLLVMEAPGYRGCRLTGIPVTSRKIMLESLPGLGIFGVDQGYRDVDEPGFEKVYGEQSATIVWGALAGLEALPMIWNAFPFHPRRAGQPLSNRKPRKAEIQLGGSFLRRVFEIWRIEQVIAVGNVAHESLLALGLPCPKLRHPAHGGKGDFLRGLAAELSAPA